MSSIDGGVATERWSCDAGVGMGQAVMAFARRHGMAPMATTDVGRAVEEAMSYAGDAVLVEAATDGEWLSVRVTGDGDEATSAGTLSRVVALSDRCEHGVASRGSGTAVLMEFAVTPVAYGRVVRSGWVRRAACRPSPGSSRR